MAAKKRKIRRSTAQEREAGLLAALQVIMADAFHSTTDNPCRTTDVRNAVATRLKYSASERSKLVDRWSQWLRGLPQSAGRVRSEEVAAISEFLAQRSVLPDYLLSRLNEFIPDATFWALCSSFGMTSDRHATLTRYFRDPAAEYQAFRYTIGEPGRIAVGKMKIQLDGGVIKTHEHYKVKKRDEHFNGYLFLQSDASYRIFSIHSGSDEVQVMLFRNLNSYTGHNHPALKGQAKRMTGTFFDRHNLGFFYTGKVALQRVDSVNHPLRLGTISERELQEYDSTIYDELQVSEEQRFKNLFTYRI